MRGGTQEVGGPSSVSRKWATANVVARFFPFFLSFPATNARYAQPATATTSLVSKREPEVVFFILSTHLPPPPPPSHPNASRGWFCSAFRHVSHHHHLPRVQTRAGGSSFRRFDRLPPPPPPSRLNASRRWYFSSFRRVRHHHLLPRI